MEGCKTKRKRLVLVNDYIKHCGNTSYNIFGNKKKKKIAINKLTVLNIMIGQLKPKKIKKIKGEKSQWQKKEKKLVQAKQKEVEQQRKVG